MKQEGLTRAQIITMAIAAGVCVANLYFNQPILGEIARSFKVPEARVGIIAVMAQAGYGLGLFFITPLGDKTNRRNLIVLLQVFLAIVLVLMCFVNSLFWMAIMNLLIGLMAVAAQVILPMAAALDSKSRGKTVGIIFTGLLIGILAARVFSGAIAEWAGWRLVYGISAALVLLSACSIRLTLPSVPPAFAGNYIELLRSTLDQLRRFPLLRRTALLGALIFGMFSSFWTTLTFHLSGPPFSYGPDTIGFFGLLAIGGASVAPVFGRLADKGRPGKWLIIAVVMIVTGVLLIKIFPHQLMAFVATVLLLDIGVQATQVTNLATIYTLDAAAHSRINTVYMTAYFIGGSLGTFAGVQCWRLGGWSLVTWQLLAWSLAALCVAWLGFHKPAAVTKT